MDDVCGSVVIERFKCVRVKNNPFWRSREHPIVRFVYLWGPACLLMAVIFGVSSLSTLPSSTTNISDKLLHGLTYALLGALILRGLANAQWQLVTGATATLASLLATLYGCSDEFHQSFVPGRSPEITDVLFDAVGATCAVVLLWAWSIIKARRARKIVHS